MFNKYYQSEVTINAKTDSEELFAFCDTHSITYSVFEKPEETKIFVYSDNADTSKTWAQLICDRFNGIVKETVQIDEEKYLLKYLDDFKPFTVGNLDIVPYFHDSYTTKRQKLIMDPGYAFGTGEHQSTKLELLFMQEMDLKGRKILDIGAGSGILSVCSSIMGASSVTALDIDDSTMYAGPRNAELNNADNISFILGNIYVLSEGTKYDILLLNMLPSNFMPFFTDVRPLMEQNAKLVLSGIIEEEADRVRDYVLSNDYKIEEERCLDGWRGFLLS